MADKWTDGQTTTTTKSRLLSLHLSGRPKNLEIN